jgi:hypothetical protein
MNRSAFFSGEQEDKKRAEQLCDNAGRNKHYRSVHSSTLEPRDPEEGDHDSRQSQRRRGKQQEKPVESPPQFSHCNYLGGAARALAQ